VSNKSPNDVDIQVGNRVRARRLMLQMSQMKLAEVLGLTFQQVQEYEKGTNRIGSPRIVQIAEALGVEPAYFYEGVGRTFTEDAASASVNRFLASKDGIRLAQAFAVIENGGIRHRLVLPVETIAGVRDGEEQTSADPDRRKAGREDRATRRAAASRH
jgi:transcriptional regulator with XRE-family HTH domain